MNDSDNRTLDLRGLACPQPVVETRRALLELGDNRESGLTVLVDNPAAAENVSRFVASQGWKVGKRTEEQETITLAIGRDPEPGADNETEQTTETNSRNQPEPRSMETPAPTGVVYLNSDRMGSGDEKLGKVLIRAFLKTLPELERLPGAIILVNSGVFLATGRSAENDCLKELADAGCEILVCGTCLDFYNLKSELAVGRVSNMFEIASRLAGPEPVIRP